MNAEAVALPMTYAEYSAFEREAAVKHEYLAGEVFARTGGTLEHSRLAMQVARLIGNALEGRPCRVLNADARVRIEAADVDTYPDLSVVCGPLVTAKEDDQALVNPVLIGEVLPKSTEAYDRGLKASHYRQIPSLQAYLLVAQHRRRLELQVRQDDGRWVIIEAGPGERLMIEPLGVELDVDTIYRDAISV